MWPISSNIILVKYQVHSAPLPLSFLTQFTLSLLSPWFKTKCYYLLLSCWNLPIILLCSVYMKNTKQIKICKSPQVTCTVKINFQIWKKERKSMIGTPNEILSKIPFFSEKQPTLLLMLLPTSYYNYSLNHHNAN